MNRSPDDREDLCLNVFERHDAGRGQRNEQHSAQLAIAGVRLTSRLLIKAGSDVLACRSESPSLQRILREPLRCTAGQDVFWFTGV
jgi:hypothetical protein